MYPTFNNPVKHTTRQQLQMLGINQSDNYVEGQLEECSGITTDKYPLMATREKLQVQWLDYDVVSMFAWEKMFEVSDQEEDEQYKCYYGGNFCGYVSKELPKQYAVVNSKLVIWPDKKLFNWVNGTGSIKSFAAEELGIVDMSGSMLFVPKTDETDAEMQFTDYDGVYRPSELVSVGQKIILSGCQNAALNYTVYTVKSTRQEEFTDIIAIEEDFPGTIENFTGLYPITFYSAGDGSLKVVPDLDVICASNNRLWGASSEQRSIYASALGDPSEFYKFEGLADDSYVAPVGTADEFTGCIALPNAVLFMKQHSIHKVLGTYPAEYTVYDYQTDGVTKDNSRSLVNCNGTAIFCSEHGISTYYGSSSGTLSKDLDINEIHEGVGCYDGEKYYLSCKDSKGVGHIYVYDMRYNIWTNIGDIYADNIEHLGDKTFLLFETHEYLINSGIELGGNWSITFKPFMEQQTDRYNNRSGIFEKKRYWKISLRIDIKKNSTFQAEIKTDNGQYRNAGRIAGEKDEVRTLYIKTDRCDKAQLKLSGQGPMTILGIERDFTIGSAR